MSTGSDLIAMIAGRQDLADYQKKHWNGTFAEYLDIVRTNPKVTRTAYQRVYDMILAARHRGGPGQQRETSPIQVLRGPCRSGPGRDFRSRPNLDEPGERPQERRASLRDRSDCGHPPCSTGRWAAPRARSPACSRKAWSITSKEPTRAPSTPTAPWREEGLDGTDHLHCRLARCDEEPLHLVHVRIPRRTLVESALAPRCSTTLPRSPSKATSARSAARPTT